MTSNSEVVPDLFYKRSQEKNTSPVAGFFLGFQPTALSRIVLAFRSLISGRCFIRAALLVFSASGFHQFLRDEAGRFGDHKQHGCQVPTMVLSGTRGP